MLVDPAVLFVRHSQSHAGSQSSIEMLRVYEYNAGFEERMSVAT